MTIRYDSRAAAYAVVDRKPAGRKSVPDPDGGFSVRLAPGNHQVTISFASTSRFPWRLVVLAALAVVVLLSVMRRARRRTS